MAVTKNIRVLGFKRTPFALLFLGALYQQAQAAEVIAPLQEINVTATAVSADVDFEEISRTTDQSLKQVLQNQIGVSIGGGEWCCSVL